MISHSPFFSIIIPVYNVAPYLRECLDSVLAQAFTDWEAICVDDGSTDGSGAILDEYAAKDERFRVVHKKNEGVGAARNSALDVAKGNWVCFLDGDDVWHKEFLATFSSAISKYPGERCFRVGYSRFSDGEVFGGGLPEVVSFRKIDISKSIEMHDFFFFFFFCYVYSKDLFNGIRFPRYIRGEDRWVLNKIQLERLDAIVATDAQLYGYRQRSGSAMNSTPSLRVLCDEMDHRLDIMGMIDESGKKVDYAGNCWLEGFFTQVIPARALDRPDDSRAIRAEWHRRLPRLLARKGLSRRGRSKLALSTHRFLRPIGDFILYGSLYLRYKSPFFRPLARVYRRIMRHGEFAREVK